MTNEAKPVRSFGQRVRHFFLRLILLVLIPLIALLVATYFYMKGGRYVSTENAYIKSHIIAISSDIDGRTVDVNVSDNQRVEAGTLLFRIDPEPYVLRVEEAEAEIALAHSAIETLRADYREAQVAIAEEAEKVRFLTTKLSRQQTLRNTGVGTEQTFDEAQHNLRIAEQRVSVLRQRAKRVLASLGGNSKSAVTSHASYIRAESRRDQAAVDLASTSVHAPSGGIVSNMHLQVGEYINAGTPVFSLLENDKIWVQANLKETQLTHLRTGQSATLRVDAYPQQEWQAQVASIAPATGAEFALLPPQNATGNWVKVVQRIPVELQVEHQPEAPPLRAGMTVSAKIDTNHRRQPPASVRRLVENDVVPSKLASLLRLTLAMDDVTDGEAATKNQKELNTNVSSTPAVTPFKEVMAANSPPTASQSLKPSSPIITNLPIVATQQIDVSPPPTLATVTPADDDSAIKREVWLAQQSEEQFTIQLGSSDNLKFLQRFAKQLPNETPSVIYHYNYTDTQQPEYGLANGLFDNWKSANEAIKKLPETHRRYDPWVRRVGDIQRSVIVN